MSSEEMSSYDSGGASSDSSDDDPDPAEDLESASESEPDSESDAEESDLADLYASFEFESDTESQLPPRTQVRPTQHALGVSNTPVYPNAQLTALQSRLLIFQYSL